VRTYSPTIHSARCEHVRARNFKPANQKIVIYVCGTEGWRCKFNRELCIIGVFSERKVGESPAHYRRGVIPGRIGITVAAFVHDDADAAGCSRTKVDDEPARIADR